MLLAMSLKLSIRPERPDDAPVVRAVVQKAFAGIGYSDHREHLLVERLRASPAYVPGLSLLAEVDGEGVGHVMLSRIEVVDRDRRVEGLSLAPLSVIPAFQRQGVGGRLVRQAHAAAKALGFPFIVLVGHAEYYPRFGYEALDGFPITLPFEVPAASRMILPLSPDALEGVQGRVEYPPAWLDH
jgi:predicted N-acetyltransferase YhbS